VPEQYPLETLRNLHRSLLLAALEAQEWSRILIRRAGHQQMLAACISDAKLWKSRLPKKDRELAEHWIGVFTNAM